MNLGHKMRQMRQMRGLTAVALAKQARVTPGFISQLEYSQTVPSLQTLQRVAAALDVSLTYFLLDASQQPQVVRHRERQRLPLAHQGARLWLLSPLPSQHLEVALLELPPGAVFWSTTRAQEGQQCHLVVHGTVRADYGDHTYGLEEGDSILWDGTLPYRIENTGNDEAQLVIAMAPASLWKQAGEEAQPATPGQVAGLAPARRAPPPRPHPPAAPGDHSRPFAYEHIKDRPKLLLAMTGLTQAAFERLCGEFAHAWEAWGRPQAPGHLAQGKADRADTSLGTIADKLLFILYYVKAHPFQEILAFEFNMTQGTANQWIHLLSGVLKHALEAGGHLPRGTEHPPGRLPELVRPPKAHQEVLSTEIARGLHHFRALYKQSGRVPPACG